MTEENQNKDQNTSPQKTHSGLIIALIVLISILVVGMCAGGFYLASSNNTVSEPTPLPVAATPTLPAPVITEPDPIPAGSPTITALVDVNVRSGPGTNYPAYGVAPQASQSIVLGVSEDGLWWVVKISTTYSALGYGWVFAENTWVDPMPPNVPTVATPPLP
jgi:hypothetical protein